MARKNEIVIALTDLLVKQGARDIQVVAGGRHNRIQFTIHGRTMFFVLSGTPGDHRSVMNAKSQLKRQIREMMS